MTFTGFPSVSTSHFAEQVRHEPFSVPSRDALVRACDPQMGHSAIGIPYAQALLISLVGFGTSLFWSAVGGFVYLTVKEKEHLAEIESVEPQEIS